MKQLVLGDTHGRTIWKQIVEKHINNFDRLIFIGDYFDTHENTIGEEQLNNFLDICAFKKTTPQIEVVMLIGNHDFHYFPGITQTCSGYQIRLRPSFERALNDNKDLLQMCFADENNIVFSHAGLSETFLKNNEIDFSQPIQTIINSVNDLWKYKPNIFGYNMIDGSGYGDNVNQSCIWIRPNSLFKDKIDYLQVVGHTTMNKLPHVPKSERTGFYLIDTLGTTKEYLLIEDGKVNIERL